MRAGLWLLLAACGRIGFADARHGDDGGGGDDAAATGDAAPPAASYLIALDDNSSGAVVAGANGRVAVSEDFQGATTIAGHAFTGHAMYVSGAVLWFDRTGAPAAATVLDSTSICSVRELDRLGDQVIAIGYTQSGQTVPADGPCALATSRQDAIALAIDAGGTPSLLGRGVSSAGNIQGWHATGFADGSIAFSGVYATNGAIGSMPFPATSSDEQPFFARVDPATGEARWLTAIASGGEQFAGPIDTRGDDACVTGGFVGSPTVFGRQLAAHGGIDQFVARVDGTGTARWVRGFGSTGDEASTRGLSVVATADGGCTVATFVGGAVAIDALTLAAGAVVVHFDGTGAATTGTSLPDDSVIAHLGDRIFAAEPNHSGIDLVSLDDATTLATITGASLTRFAVVPPNVLAVTFVASPPTTFAGMSLSSSGNALAVLGL